MAKSISYIRASHFLVHHSTLFHVLPSLADMYYSAGNLAFYHQQTKYSFDAHIT